MLGGPGNIYPKRIKTINCHCEREGVFGSNAAKNKQETYCVTKRGVQWRLLRVGWLTRKRKRRSLLGNSECCRIIVVFVPSRTRCPHFPHVSDVNM
jgi:hypothetical protein